MFVFAVRVNKKRIVTAAAVLAAVLMIVTCLFGASETENAAVGKEYEAVRLPVIMYHGVLDREQGQNQYMIDVKYFEDDLKYLTENGYQTVTVDDLVQYFDCGTPLPEKAVMLTFDDGYYNNYALAYPLLKKYQCRAVLSPLGIEADKAETPEQAQNRSVLYSQCSWKELAEMAHSGLVELQNHSFDLHHTDKGRQGAAPKKGEDAEEYRKMLIKDLQEANRAIHKGAGVTPICFTCPFGAKSEETLRVVKELGFRAMMDCEEKINVLKSPDDLYALHRYLRPNGISAQEFFDRWEREMNDI